MSTEFFKAKNFKADSLAIIVKANEIITAYRAQGYTLTLRQLYYQFVARDLVPNTEQSYKRIGSILNDARMAGMVDWEAIEDRTRGVERNLRLRSPKHAVEVVRAQYGIDMWANQPNRVEVWIEKEALVGVIEAVCKRHDVPYLACRGYVSASEQWRAYRRIRGYFEQDDSQTTTILHLGDHDPSGIDMTRDNDDRLGVFLQGDAPFAYNVIRIALNADQIAQYNPPPNPAKQTDARFADYAAKHGDESWELDALEPAVLTKLIEKHIKENRDAKLWQAKVEQLEEEKARLDEVIAELGDEDGEEEDPDDGSNG